MTKNTQLILAPMAGITDKAFREICTDWEVDVTWSEMVSAEGLVRNSLEDNKSLELAERFGEGEKNYWVQIFGCNPKSMAEAAKIIEKEINPTGIDINLGCPVKKAQKAGYGAVQMGKIPEVIEIIRAIKETTSLPLSLKTRVGLTNPQEVLEFAPKLEKAGIDQLVIHARTLKGMFFETPHWEIAKQLKNNLNIPVIYNGGIKTHEDAIFYQEKTGCEKLMIGQAAFGKPWIFWQIKNGTNDDPPIEKIKETILKHADLCLKYYGEKSLVTFRTHLSAYLKGRPNASRLKQEAVKINSLEDIRAVVDKF
ncbi:MAG: tRNA-dihydrouridine synthase family protein [Candidatus Moranbacteria bacterium]|nr:tRNA-dihydrouridine synthase family protein [Candidatus Moranbacteria bacterium]